MQGKDEQEIKKFKFDSTEIQTKEPLIPPFEEKSEKCFIMDFCVSIGQSLIGCITSSREFFFFENTYNHRLVCKREVDVLQTGIWYLEKHGI